MAPIDVLPKELPPPLVVGLVLLGYGVFVAAIVTFFALLAARTDVSQDAPKDLDQEDRSR